MGMNIYNNLKNNLKSLRVSQELSQKQLSGKTNIPRANISRYETGENIPPLDVLCVFADFFDTTLDELVGRDG